MDERSLRQLLSQVRDGKVTLEQAVEKLKDLPFEDMGYAKLDYHRAIRTGYPEVVYCPGKTTHHIVAIFKKLSERHANVLATRANPDIYRAVKAEVKEAEYHELARAITLRRDRTHRGIGKIVVVSAGTADLPVAEEAVVTAEMFGNCVERLYDVGVAGIHRLLGHRHVFKDASVVIVVAGMEGALASVVGGLTDKPVIAVPTSVGYGANFQGLSALLAMLTSCAAGVTVVNIDNGFGAGYAASLINRVRNS